MLEGSRSQFRIVDGNVELLFERRHQPEGIDGVQAEPLAIQARLRPLRAKVRWQVQRAGDQNTDLLDQITIR